MFDGFEKSIIVVGEEARVRERCFTQYVISVEYFMEQAVSELWIGRCLQERPDQEGQ